MKNINFIKNLRDCVDTSSIVMYNKITEEKRKKYYIQAEQAANLLLNEIGDKKFPVDINKIVSFFDINAVNSNLDNVDFLNNRLHGKLHTVIVFKKGRKNKKDKDKIIELFINDSDSDKVARMTVLSSIGLLIWGYSWDNKNFFDFLYSNNEDNKDDEDDKDDEVNELSYIYHSFARSVLIPEKEISKLNKHYLEMNISDEERIKKIADFFGVEEQEVKNKLYSISKYGVCE